MVATRDVVANLYSQPQFVVSLGAAVRSFGDACTNTADPNNMLAKHPRDFELWHLGEYEDETGRFTVKHDGSAFEPRQIAVGANYATKQG